MKFVRFLFFVFLFTCCLFTCPGTAFSEGGYQFVTKWGNNYPTIWPFRFTTGVATDLFGDVYVLDRFNFQVRKYTSNGTLVTTWGSLGKGWGRRCQVFTQDMLPSINKGAQLKGCAP